MKTDNEDNELDSEKIKYLGQTEDILHRTVHMYSSEDLFFCVYNQGTENQYITSEEISEVQNNPDNYAFTPYVEFIHLF